MSGVRYLKESESKVNFPERTNFFINDLASSGDKAKCSATSSTVWGAFDNNQRIAFLADCFCE
ncbi:MAG: hypothetical protein RO469_13990 [Thermincola sp.]|nr:hypothetical protein [Thermincola sp.]